MNLPTRARIVTAVSQGEVEKIRLISGFAAIVSAVTALTLGTAGATWVIWVAGVLNLGAAGLIWWIGEVRAGSKREAVVAAREETMVDVAFILQPLLHDLGRVAALRLPERRNERGALQRAVVNAASGLSGTARLRACYFVLSDDQKSMDCRAYVGRANGPAEGFREGRKSGDRVLAMVKAGGKIFVENTDDSAPPGWVPSNHNYYKTFISVTVGTPGNPIGMLTLDAPKAGDLVQEDVDFLVALGNLLGVCETLTT